MIKMWVMTRAEARAPLPIFASLNSLSTPFVRFCGDSIAFLGAMALRHFAGNPVEIELTKTHRAVLLWV
jgi:hypothetical protein